MRGLNLFLQSSDYAFQHKLREIALVFLLPVLREILNPECLDHSERGMRDMLRLLIGEIALLLARLAIRIPVGMSREVTGVFDWHSYFV